MVLTLLGIREVDEVTKRGVFVVRQDDRFDCGGREYFLYTGVGLLLYIKFVYSAVQRPDVVVVLVEMRVYSTYTVE